MDFREKQNELFREYEETCKELLKVMGKLTDILRVYKLVNCPLCDGDGDDFINDICEKCQGTGVVKERDN